MVFENLTKIAVILFTLFNVLLLNMCCNAEFSEGMPPTLLKYKDAFGQLQPCEFEGKKIYQYKSVTSIGRLLDYRGYGDVGIQDKGGLFYEDKNGLHPLVSFRTPFQHGNELNFSIINKQNLYIVYYYMDDEYHLDTIFVENQPFSKNIEVKEVKRSYLNKLYMEKAGCFLEKF